MNRSRSGWALLLASVLLAGCADLVDAVRSDDRRAVDALLAGGANVNQTDSSGYTPLHYAALQGSVPVCIALLARGADVNARTPDGVTPLQLAAGSRKPELVLELIQRGADVNAQDAHGATPLFMATTREPERAPHDQGAGVAVVLVDHGARFDQGIWYDAIKAGFEELVELLIVRGVGMGPDKDGLTPLHALALWGNALPAQARLASLMIAAGARVDAKTPLGQTALEQATSPSLAEVLRAHGAVGESGAERQEAERQVFLAQERIRQKELVRLGKVAAAQLAAIEAATRAGSRTPRGGSAALVRAEGAHDRGPAPQAWHPPPPRRCTAVSTSSDSQHNHTWAVRCE